MNISNEKPSVAYRKFCDAAHPLAVEIIASLPEAMQNELGQAIMEQSFIGFSMRMDFDFASHAPTVVYEFIRNSGARFHVQSRTLIAPPSKDE